jgi:hypothetical protein
MPWAKIDDTLHVHPKFEGISDSAAGVWLKCLSWCARYGTDGVISEQQIRARCASTRRFRGVLKELIEVRLLDLVETNKCTNGELRLVFGKNQKVYRIHDYLGYNPSADEYKKVKEEQKDTLKERARKGGLAKAAKQKQADHKQKQADEKAACGLLNSTPDPVPVPDKIYDCDTEKNPNPSDNSGSGTIHQAASSKKKPLEPPGEVLGVGVGSFSTSTPENRSEPKSTKPPAPQSDAMATSAWAALAEVLRKLEINADAGQVSPTTRAAWHQLVSHGIQPDELAEAIAATKANSTARTASGKAAYLVSVIRNKRAERQTSLMAVSQYSDDCALVVAEYRRQHEQKLGRHIKEGHSDWSMICERLKEGATSEDCAMAIKGNKIDDFYREKRLHRIQDIFKDSATMQRFAQIGREGMPVGGWIGASIEMMREFEEEENGQKDVFDVDDETAILLQSKD